VTTPARGASLASALAFRTSVPGFSPGKRPRFLVSTSPLPAALAGSLPPLSQRSFRIRVVTRGISNGSVAAFRHRRSPPDLLLPEPRCLPCGRLLGGLRVFLPVPRSILRCHPGVMVSLAFSLNPAPHGLRFGVRAFPAVPISRSLRNWKPACASYPALSSPSVSIRLARRHFPHDLSIRVVRLPPLRASNCARTVRLHLPQGSAGTHYMIRSSADSSRFLPYGRPAASIRLFGTYCLRRVLPLNLRDLSEPSYSYKLVSVFRQEFSF
jgi:hypothetical protein